MTGGDLESQDIDFLRSHEVLHRGIEDRRPKVEGVSKFE